MVSKYLGMKPPTLSTTVVTRGLSYFPKGHGYEHVFAVFRKGRVTFGRIPLDDKVVYWEIMRKWTPQCTVTHLHLLISPLNPTFLVEIHASLRDFTLRRTYQDRQSRGHQVLPCRDIGHDQQILPGLIELHAIRLSWALGCPVGTLQERGCDGCRGRFARIEPLPRSGWLHGS